MVCKVIAGIQRGNELERTWVLVWEDQFHHVDVGPWWLYSATYDGNPAYCVPGNVVSQDGKLRLYFKKEEVHGKNYSSAEYLGSLNTTPYGKLVLSMKTAPGKALVTSLGLSSTQAGVDEGCWITYWGNLPYLIDFGHSLGEKKRETQLPIAFPADRDFHQYGIEWGPDRIKWSIDGKSVGSSDQALWPGKKVNLTLRVFAFNPTNSWAPKIDDRGLPAYAECEYLRYYMKLKQ
jgi:beta-glucanase (GH16 family)